MGLYHSFLGRTSQISKVARMLYHFIIMIASVMAIFDAYLTRFLGFSVFNNHYSIFVLKLQRVLLAFLYAACWCEVI